jgi:hypothetical protein
VQLFDLFHLAAGVKTALRDKTQRRSTRQSLTLAYRVHNLQPGGYKKMRILSITVLTLSYALVRAQSSATVPANLWSEDKAIQMIVTAEPFQGLDTPFIPPGNVSAFQDRMRLPVTEWVPLQGDKADLELYFLIDERVNPDQPALFQELHEFVKSLPPSTAVGIAYMYNGEATIAQTPTRDHERAAASLRTTSGKASAGASPYVSLSALIAGWEANGAARHEVVLFTDGIDRFENIGSFNMYVKETIGDAQREGIVAYCIYVPALGHAGHSPALIHWGQTYLGQLAEETGGEAYFNGSEPPASFEPYLSDISRHLAHQYRVTFLAVPRFGDGFQPIHFEASVPNVELIAAYRFYLKAPPESVP